MACSHWANVPETIRRTFESYRQPPSAINREPQRVPTGATAALTSTMLLLLLFCKTDHTIAHPGCGASTKRIAVASPIFPVAR